MSSPSAPYLHNEVAAHEFVEGVLWPDGPVCPRCGGLDRITKVKARTSVSASASIFCGDCKRQFTVKVGTIFEDSKIGLHLWMQAIVLMTASKKGIEPRWVSRRLQRLRDWSLWRRERR
jgi:transposase-like protein